ncbi:CLUMA_CG000260, isoform A [Clunio marinus]|uniref:CLUMA_CG000260, isoform A n=1 Tax=Clunio marinus TaxID=568069 RepID=A0A1J1HIA8_9DIPT|nr:CLUMA_CG000260, isoform A [Clunio marinus]
MSKSASKKHQEAEAEIVNDDNNDFNLSEDEEGSNKENDVGEKENNESSMVGETNNSLSMSVVDHPMSPHLPLNEESLAKSP